MWIWIKYALLQASVAFGQAGGTGTTGGAGGQNGGQRVITIPPMLDCADLRCVIFSIIDKAILLAYPVLTLLILWGAFQILTSGGSAERVTSGRKTIMWAVIGFVLILLAKGFGLIIQDVLGVGGTAGATSDLMRTIDRLIGWIFTFLIVTSVFMVLYAAYLYVTAGGDSESVSKANRTLLYAAIGLAIAVLSRTIPYVVKGFVQGSGTSSAITAPFALGYRNPLTAV